jgi:Tfp pilus assembly protein PilX
MAFVGVLLALVVAMLFALSYDVGAWAVDHRLAQNQADAAALAAVQELPDTTEALAVAQEWVERNGGDADDIDMGCSEITTTTALICVRRQSNGIFSSLSGISFAWISAKAKASVTTVPVRYAIMALDTSGCAALQLGGNAVINITNDGGSYTRSDCPTNALNVSGTNPRLVSAVNDIMIGGGSSYAPGTVSPTPSPQVFIPDPYADLDETAFTSSPGSCLTPTSFSGNTVATIYPGRYCAELRVTAGAKVTVTPGIYILEAGMTVNGNNSGSFSSNGGEVLFYSTCPAPYPCGSTRSPGTISIGGNGVVNLTGHSEWENLIFWFDRTGSGGELSVAGGGTLQFYGSTYGLNAGVRLTGGGTGTTTVLNMSFVANTVTLQGNGTITIPYSIDLAPKIRKITLEE